MHGQSYFTLGFLCQSKQPFAERQESIDLYFIKYTTTLHYDHMRHKVYKSHDSNHYKIDFAIGSKNQKEEFETDRFEENVMRVDLHYGP